MNGMRRFLGGGLGTPSPTSQSLPQPNSASSPPPDGPTTAPLSIGKPSWPPSPVRSSLDLPDSPKTSTAALFLRKDRQRATAQGPTSTSNSNSGSNLHSNSGCSEEDSGNSSFRSSRDSHDSPRSLASTGMSSPGAGPSSPRVVPHRVSELSRKPVVGTVLNSKRISNFASVRDDLLLDLLASEAVVDSRTYEVLSAEEVEELKKVC